MVNTAWAAPSHSIENIPVGVSERLALTSMALPGSIRNAAQVRLPNPSPWSGALLHVSVRSYFS